MTDLLLRYPNNVISAELSRAMQPRASVYIRVYATDLAQHVVRRHGNLWPCGLHADMIRQRCTDLRCGQGQAPTIGFVADPAGDLAKRMAWADPYGDTVVKLRDTAKSRTSICLEDAFFNSSPCCPMDHDLSYAHLAHTSGEDLRFRIEAFMHRSKVDDLVPRALHSLFGHPVIQAHIWQPVGPQDIEAILVRAENGLPDLVHSALAENGLQHIPLWCIKRHNGEDWIRFANKANQTQYQPERTHLVDAFPVVWWGEHGLAIRGCNVPEQYRRLFLPRSSSQARWLEATDILYLHGQTWSPMAIRTLGSSVTTTLETLMGQSGSIRHSCNRHMRGDCIVTWQESLGLSNSEVRAVAQADQDMELRHPEAARKRAHRTIAKYYLQSATAEPHLRC